MFEFSEVELAEVTGMQIYYIDKPKAKLFLERKTLPQYKIVAQPQKNLGSILVVALFKCF